MRPADLLFPDRPKALAEERCVVAPIGCGKPIGKFDDAVSLKEYTISGLCQECQDSIFGGDDE